MLGYWLDAARASVAPSADPALADAISNVIELQAVIAALGDLDALPPVDRPFARDRAAVLIERAAAALDEAYRGRTMPEELLELLDDAPRALERSTWAGTVELIWPGPGPLVMPVVPVDATSGGTLAVMQPGTIAHPEQCIAWWLDVDGTPIAESVPGTRCESVDVPRQVYRMLDEDGRITGDEERLVTDDPVAGLPLLVPLRAGGETIGHFTMEPDEWLAKQRSAGLDA